MDWKFDIGEKKIDNLKARIERLNIDLNDIDEEFIRGGGKGGQKINKTSSCVRMTYRPLNIQVRSQKTRERNKNRFLALRELVDQIEMKLDPASSKRVQQAEKARSKKAKSKARARKRLARKKAEQDGGDD